MIKYSKVIYEPQTEPVTSTEAKAQLRVTHSSDDTYITRLITVARRLCEKDAGRSFITQTREVKLDAFPSCNEVIEIPYGPVIALSGSDGDTPANTLGITYIDEDGATQTLTVNTDFYLDSHSDIARLYPVDDWPTDVDDERIHPISIKYTAGYGAAGDVPQEAKQAILSEITNLYENRGDGKMSELATHLLDSIRVYHNARQD